MLFDVLKNLLLRIDCGRRDPTPVGCAKLKFDDRARRFVLGIQSINLYLLSVESS